MFRIAVTNTGNIALTDVDVSDPIAPGCDATLPSLAVGETWLVTCTVSAIAEAFTNTASVSASTPVGLPSTTDSTVAPDRTMSANESDTTSVVVTTSIAKDSTILTALAHASTSTWTLAGVSIAMLVTGVLLIRRRKQLILNELDYDDPAAITAVARLTQDCTEAKEALSSDADTTIRVLLPNHQTQVRITRKEFEDLCRPAITSTIEATRRAISYRPASN